MNEPAFWDAYRVHLSASRAPRTVRAYLDVARDFAAFLKYDTADRTATRERGASAAALFSEISVRDVEGYLAMPSKRGAPRAVTTRNQILAALRVFCAFGEREGHASSNPARAVAFLREPPRTPSVLDTREVTALARASMHIKDERSRRQSLAMTALLVLCGLRVSELVMLDIHQVDAEASVLRGVVGKGGTRHDVVLSPQAARLVVALLADRRDRPSAVDALFVSRERTRLSIRSVQRHVKALGLAIHRRLTPHALRHTSATAALTLGVDVSTVSEHLRHASLATTQRYLHFGLERRRAAAAKLGMLFPDDVVMERSAGADANVIHNEPVDAFGD